MTNEEWAAHVAALEAEVRDLTCSRDLWQREATLANQTVTELEAELKRLREALGLDEPWHECTCAYWRGKPCSRPEMCNPRRERVGAPTSGQGAAATCVCPFPRSTCPMCEVACPACEPIWSAVAPAAQPATETAPLRYCPVYPQSLCAPRQDVCAAGRCWRRESISQGTPHKEGP